VGLERSPLSLVRINKELFQGNSGSGLENRKINGRGDSLRWPRDILYPLKWALSSSTSDGRSVDIVRLRTETTEFVCFFVGRNSSLSLGFYIITAMTVKGTFS
jgi:hypothetical protein